MEGIMIAGILWAAVLLSVQGYQPMAEQTWITVGQASLSYNFV